MSADITVEFLNEFLELVKTKSIQVGYVDDLKQVFPWIKLANPCMPKNLSSFGSDTSALKSPARMNLL